MSKRIGIFGGSFDPVHLGHLWIAESARESLSLDEIRWMPAATSPLKPSGPVASNEHRVQMVRLAISGNPHFVVDDREIRRGDVSYTVDTIAEIQAENRLDEFFLIIGSDSLASFNRWHEPARLLGLINLAVVQRGGDPPINFDVLEPFAASKEPAEKTASVPITRSHDHVIVMPVIEISSSDLRHRIADRKSIRYRVPAAVESMIMANQLYQSKDSDKS
ncbi:nicotinate (nicotinamide) nucleotide adenylyltransferase [Rubripirellula reticaptiva]|uniref:Probable nicotinate-nucleotide adenylyltransferase n=1 Tax=Rubripirellula reticaptiva TaxID=2528013 RepID=A0A5C6F9J6_9BACT|nr:nicotinate (nicotinamide) nucleotide adenylyltransferase [Rubripirellula reticaptiva]TWU57230.1 Nicotinate-nucleotide adenylyltransferase [Rubripirellula reticaptiva]